MTRQLWHKNNLIFFPKQLWSWMGFSLLPRNRLCSIIIFWFRLGFRGLSPYSFGVLFPHHFLVPARVPWLVSLLFWHSVPSSFPGSGWGSVACLPTLLASCSIIISWFRLGFRGLFPYYSGTPFHHHFLLPARFRGLFPYSFGILLHHHFLVPARVPGLVSLLFWNPVPSSFPGSR